MATLSNCLLILLNALAINDITKEAFHVLSNNGKIKVVEDHSCSECIHEYKATADVISREDYRQNPAALLDVNENHIVLSIQGKNADLIANTALARAATDKDVEMNSNQN